MGATSARLRREPPLLWLIGAVSVTGTGVVGALTGVGSAIAAAIGALVALATVGWSLWRTAPNPQEAKSSLGTGLLVSVVVAGAVGGAQFAIDDRRSGLEERRDLRITLSMRQSLKGIDLSGRDLRGFIFARKDLGAARLGEAELGRANLDRARLAEASLTRAYLRGASLFEADLSRADLTHADLREANLTGAKLATADLAEAKLAGTRLGADFRKATISYSLRDAHLAGARLFGANLSSAKDLGEANLHGAFYDSETTWPRGFDPAAAGAERLDRA